MPRSLLSRVLAVSAALAAAVPAPAQPARPAATPAAPNAGAGSGAGRVGGAERALTRLPDGRPGPAYWQQQVDYSLDATLDPARRVLTGRGTITYHNNSPDALAELRWHLYQNLFRADSGTTAATIVGREMTRTSGIRVTRVAAAGRALTPVVTRTLMRTALPAPLAPGDSLQLDVEWTLDVPAVASLRTGSAGEDFGMAQWYPQVSTYDDVHGWHDLPYEGQGEFHLEYGRWDVRLTLPRRFLVAATGTLRNPDAVLAPAQAGALRRAASAPAGQLARVVSAADTGGRGAPPGRDRTWRFTAERVRDFAWAASPRFLWHATRTGPLATRPEGALIHSFFPPNESEHYAASYDVARRSIEFFSARFGDYPYPQATTVSGPVEGMEYPMLVFEGVTTGWDALWANFPELVTVHELGHEWYPMLVGSNETRHAFMDEGFNTFIEMDWFRERYGRGGYWSARMPRWLRGLLGPGDHRRMNYAQARLLGATVPLMTPADSVPPAQLGTVAYQKPAAALVMLRDVLGDSVFYAALREYTRRWSFRHPYPDDFFRTVESVAGRELDWFWRPWFYETRRLDLALGGVQSERRGDGYAARVDVRNRGAVAMPATVKLTLDDGSARLVRLPESAWRGTDTVAAVEAAGLPAPVRHAELDPEQVLFDARRANNVWPAGAPTTLGPLFGVTWRGLFGLLALAAAIAVLVRAVGLWDGIRLSKFRPVRYAVGPFSLWSARRGFHLRRMPGPRLYGAGVLALPPHGADLARGTAYLASAGPVASLLAAAVVFSLVFLLERRYDAGLRPTGSYLLDSALFLIGAAAVLGFVRVLRPRRARGAYVSSAPWVRLLTRPHSPAMRRWAAVRALVAQSFAGERPRAWDPAWIEAATAESDGSAAEAGACMLAYLWALDRGDTPAAGDFLERARGAAGRRWWRFRMRRHVNAEAAFFAAYAEGDVETGRHLFTRTNARRAPRHVRRRARAAVLLGERDLARAGVEARAGLLDDARTEAWGGAGVATFERYWLAVLLAAADGRAGAAVVTPSTASVAVVAGRS